MDIKQLLRYIFALLCSKIVDNDKTENNVFLKMGRLETHSKLEIL
jgi:hypothetical protein